MTHCSIPPRTESVAEKMLTNWFTFLLYKFLKVGQVGGGRHLRVGSDGMHGGRLEGNWSRHLREVLRKWPQMGSTPGRNIPGHVSAPSPMDAPPIQPSPNLWRVLSWALNTDTKPRGGRDWAGASEALA